MAWGGGAENLPLREARGCWLVRAPGPGPGRTSDPALRKAVQPTLVEGRPVRHATQALPDDGPGAPGHSAGPLALGPWPPRPPTARTKTCPRELWPWGTGDAQPSRAGLACGSLPAVGGRLPPRQSPGNSERWRTPRTHATCRSTGAAGASQARLHHVALSVPKRVKAGRGGDAAKGAACVPSCVSVRRTCALGRGRRGRRGPVCRPPSPAVRTVF